MNKQIKVKDFIDFKNSDLINIPSNIGYYELECLHAAANNEIIRLEKEERTIISEKYYNILKDWSNLLLIICTNRIELENIQLSNEYLTIKGKMGI